MSPLRNETEAAVTKAFWRVCRRVWNTVSSDLGTPLPSYFFPELNVLPIEHVNQPSPPEEIKDIVRARHDRTIRNPQVFRQEVYDFVLDFEALVVKRFEEKAIQLGHHLAVSLFKRHYSPQEVEDILRLFLHNQRTNDQVLTTEDKLLLQERRLLDVANRARTSLQLGNEIRALREMNILYGVGRIDRAQNEDLSSIFESAARVASARHLAQLPQTPRAPLILDIPQENPHAVPRPPEERPRHTGQGTPPRPGGDGP